MILPDVNVLIHAFRSDSTDHARYRQWLESVAGSHATFGIAPQVLARLVRICTNPRIFARPSAPEDAFAFCNALLSRPNASVLTPGERHWTLFESLCQASGATGNLAQDAWFAALAIESGAEWITTDRDYARFTGLRWRPPF